MRGVGHSRLEPIDGGYLVRPCAGGLAHLLLIEVDGFAALRRRLGMARIELLMLDVAERIAALVPHASVAPTGRNLIEVRMRSDSTAAFDSALAALDVGFAAPFIFRDESVTVALRWGAATVSVAQAGELELVERAEQALADARGTDAALARPASSPDGDALLGHELQAAVDREELFLLYQPKLHLRRQKITSIEALIRWNHPTRGLVMPNDFIPVAERTGDIAAVTLWTLRQAIADQKALVRNGHDLKVFVNIAGALLADAAFVEHAIATIGASGPCLGIEITETSVIGDPEGAIEHLKRLAGIGVVVTIDDYGAGLSSLVYLKQLPASELKIDKMFVTQLSSSHRDPLIVRSTIDLAHALDMEVVAEGVETASSLALLSVMGCDMAQGFLISRPIALEALYDFMRDEAHIADITTIRSPFEKLAAVRARAS